MASKSFVKSWGAEYVAAGTVRFRLWATGQDQVVLRLAGKETAMRQSGDGWFGLQVDNVLPGAEYNFILADGTVVPDPASRAQKADVNGPPWWLILAATPGRTQPGEVARGKRPWFTSCTSARLRRKARFRPPSKNCPGWLNSALR